MFAWVPTTDAVTSTVTKQSPLGRIVPPANDTEGAPATGENTGVPQPEIVAKYSANAPLAFVDQYIGNLRQYRAISMDVGDQDGLRFDAIKLHTMLDNYGIANSFEIYSGTHVSAVADRVQNHVLPFFSKNLCFTASCR